MKMLRMTMILIHLTSISPKRYIHSSESIENILYYKDCNHKQTPTAKPLQLRLPQEQQECKMRCTMCCGDQCVDSQKMSPGRQLGQMNIEPNIPQNINPPTERRKKVKPQMPLIPPIPERRIGFTRENVKALISKDEDIKKILRDLVRVAMQKVDLMQLMNVKESVKREQERSADDSDSENDL